jgi:hypothetical protein
MSMNECTQINCLWIMAGCRASIRSLRDIAFQFGVSEGDIRWIDYSASKGLDG